MRPALAVRYYVAFPRHRGLRPGTGWTGEARGEDGLLKVRFQLCLGPDGRVAEARYECSTCVALVAYCERLAELCRGRSPEQLTRGLVRELLASFPEVPPYRWGRARLAVWALLRALEAGMADGPPGASRGSARLREEDRP